jgi:peptidyl-prolyl cis-trans isomerase SDCCAG10
LTCEEIQVCLETTVGDIDVELWSRECPLACRNFVQLCMEGELIRIKQKIYIKLIIEGYYNGCTFHRLVKDFIVQTGDPTGTGHGGESIYGGVFKVIQFLHNIARYNIFTCYRMSHIKGSNSVGVV